MPQKQMPILIVIVCVALTACVGSRTASPPLPKPTVYEWIGASPPPSLQRLAQDKLTCFHEAEQTDTQKAPGVVSEHWKTHVKLCMQKLGWGEKAVE